MDIANLLFLSGVYRADIHCRVGEIDIVVHRQATADKLFPILKTKIPITCYWQISVDTNHRFIKNRKKGCYHQYQIQDINQIMKIKLEV